MSVTEYSKLRTISRQAVLERLSPIFKPMIGVKKAEKVGKSWILYVDEAAVLTT